jgi:hypothetical protein
MHCSHYQILSRAHPELVEGFLRALKETLLSPASLLFAGVPVCRESEHGEKLVQGEREKTQLK